MNKFIDDYDFMSDAFKSLDEIADTEDQLIDEDKTRFDLADADDVSALSGLVAQDDMDKDDPIQAVIDIDADDTDDLHPTYEGEAILVCPACKRSHFRKIADLIASGEKEDDDHELYNIGDECPHCRIAERGFIVDFKVMPFDEEAKDELESEDNGEDVLGSEISEVVDDADVDTETEPQEVEESRVDESLKENLVDVHGTRTTMIYANDVEVEADNLEDADEEISDMVDAGDLYFDEDDTYDVVDVDNLRSDDGSKIEESLTEAPINDDPSIKGQVASAHTIKQNIERNPRMKDNTEKLKMLLGNIEYDIENHVEDWKHAKNQKGVNEIIDTYEASIDAITPKGEKQLKLAKQVKKQLLALKHAINESAETLSAPKAVCEKCGKEICECESPALDENMTTGCNKDVTDINENKFNELVTNYLHEVYENADKFEITEGLIDHENNSIILEGTITFKSGNTKNTKFIFEADSITKKGKVKFVGLNETFSGSKKAFTLTGSLTEGMFDPEKLNYAYRAKDLNESKRVYGTVKLVESADQEKHYIRKTDNGCEFSLDGKHWEECPEEEYNEYKEGGYEDVSEACEIGECNEGIVKDKVLAALEDAGRDVEDLKENVETPATPEVKVGDTIKIIMMDGEPDYTNKTGVVEEIDDAGLIHGTWGGCALIPEADKFEIINSTVSEDLTEKFGESEYEKVEFSEDEKAEMLKIFEANKKDKDAIRACLKMLAKNPENADFFDGAEGQRTLTDAIKRELTDFQLERLPGKVKDTAKKVGDKITKVANKVLFDEDLDEALSELEESINGISIDTDNGQVDVNVINPEAITVTDDADGLNINIQQESVENTNIDTIDDEPFISDADAMEAVDGEFEQPIEMAAPIQPTDLAQAQPTDDPIVDDLDADAEVNAEFDSQIPETSEEAPAVEEPAEPELADEAEPLDIEDNLEDEEAAELN